MNKESWFQSGLSEQLRLLQQRIRCMHEYEVAKIAAAIERSGSNGKALHITGGLGAALEEASDLVRFDPSVEVFIPSTSINGIVSLGEPISTMTIKQSPPSPRANKHLQDIASFMSPGKALQGHRKIESVDVPSPPSPQLHHPLLSQKSHSNYDLESILSEEMFPQKPLKKCGSMEIDSWKSLKSNSTTRGSLPPFEHPLAAKRQCSPAASATGSQVGSCESTSMQRPHHKDTAEHPLTAKRQCSPDSPTGSHAASRGSVERPRLKVQSSTLGRNQDDHLFEHPLATRRQMSPAASDHGGESSGSKHVAGRPSTRMRVDSSLAKEEDGTHVAFADQKGYGHAGSEVSTSQERNAWRSSLSQGTIVENPASDKSDNEKDPSTFIRSRTLTNIMKDAETAPLDGWLEFVPYHGLCCCCSWWASFREWSSETHREEVLVTLLDIIMGGFILLNCLLIGVSMETEDWAGWYAVEVAFTSLFIIELTIKFRYLGWHEMLCGRLRGWTLFDLLVISFAVIDLASGDIGSVTVFRILRLGRTVRLVRLIRMSTVKELVMLLRGFVGGAKCLFWCLVALSLPVFLIGMLLTHFLTEYEDPDQLFSSVPMAMFTTIRCMCGECTDTLGQPIILHLAKSQGWYLAIVYALFILITIFGVFNLITAIFIEGTMQIAKSDTDLQRQLRMQSDKKFARNIKKLVFMFWNAAENEGRNSQARMTDAMSLEKFNISDAMDLEITQQLYDELVSFECVREVMDDMGLQDDDIVDLFQMLDVDNSGTLDVNELVTGIHKLRGDATKRDLVALAYMIYAMQDTIRSLSGDVVQLTTESQASTKVSRYYSNPENPPCGA